MNTEKEIWKDVKGYEGHYQVSCFGRVKSIKKGELILNPIKQNIGYLAATLWLKNNPKTIRVHQLVAIAFLGHMPNGFNKVVDHINGNKLDNRVENLQIVTNRINTSKDKHKLGKSSKFTGVSFFKRDGNYTAAIKFKGRNIHLGFFDKEEDAGAAYQKTLLEIECGVFIATAIPEKKGYYFSDYHGKYVIDMKGLPNKVFLTEKEAIDFIINYDSNTYVKTQHKNYYFENTRQKWAAKGKGIPLKRFKTEQQAIDYINTFKQNLCKN